jgi:mannose-6-phosphate isomerase-like protein (cupin superfamily)
MTEAPSPFVSQAHEGRVVRALARELLIRMPSERVGSAFALWESRAHPGDGPPRHIHHREGEVFQILQGHFRVWCEGASFELEPGGVAMIPRGHAHTFRSLGPHPGRMLTHGRAGRPRQVLRRGRGLWPNRARPSGRAHGAWPSLWP